MFDYLESWRVGRYYEISLQFSRDTLWQISRFPKPASFSQILEENLKIRWVKTVKIIIFPSFSHIKMIMTWGKRPSSPNMSGKRPGVRTTDGLTMVDFCHAESTGNLETRAKNYHPNCSDNHATALQNQTQEGKLLANLRNSFWLAFLLQL